MAAGAHRPITTAGILQNPHIPAAGALAKQVVALLTQYGVSFWQNTLLAETEIGQRMAETGLLIALGGDGTLLRAARIAASHPTLILGINLGRMGFLTEAEPDGWQAVLPRVLHGDYWIEERMMLHVEARRGDERLASGEALNDVVVGQGAPSRVVRLEVRVDGDLLTHYVADALIVATPTGSTAYALAAGGPIMPPEQHNVLLVPVAPHLSLDRAVVLSRGVCVQVVIRGHLPATLTVDGETVVDLRPGDVVDAGASTQVARFARVRERDYFYRTLMARLVPRRRDVE